MIIPGNENTDISENWFPYVKKGLEKLDVKVIAKNMPDPDIAREKYWLPFIEKEVGWGDDVILMGHSSGAVAIMRYLENHSVKIAVLVGACYTDLDDKKEKESGYYNRPWQWNKIKKNAQKIIQFASTNDPYIPISEARHIRDNLDTEYYEYSDQGHFGSDVGKTKFPEIIKVIKNYL